MSDMELEIHFHAQDVVSVLIHSALPAGEEDQHAELVLFALVAARQVANLADHPSNVGLTAILAAVPADELVALADHNSPDGPRLVAYQGGPGRVRFMASLTMEPFRFRLDAKGMGFFAKGSGYYAPQSVMAVLRHLADRHRHDPAFLAGLAATARSVGEAGQAGRVTVTSQVQVAMKAFQVGLLTMAATADSADVSEDAPLLTTLSDEDYYDALRTIYWGGTRFAVAAAHFALQEAAQSAADAGADPLGELTTDLLASIRLVTKRMPAHAAHFAEQLGESARTVRQPTIAEQADALKRLKFPVTSNDELNAHYEGMVVPIAELVRLCSAAGREANTPAVVTYMELWSSDVPKLDDADIVPLGAADRAALAPTLRACLSLTEAAAAMNVAARSCYFLDDEVLDELVSSGELLEETTSDLTDHLEENWLEADDLPRAARHPFSLGLLGAAHLSLAFLQPLLMRAEHADAKETSDLLDDLAQAKDHLREAIALLGL